MRELVATIAKPLALSLFLRQSFPSLPQRQLKNALGRRDVKREGRRLGPGDLVFPGDRLQVFIDERYLAAPRPEILFADENLLLAVKQPGISVTEDKAGAGTLEALVRQEYPGARACHRLDFYTGGLVVFSLNERSRLALEAAFRDRSLNKFYRCLVFGKPVPGRGLLRGYLKKEADKALARISGKENCFAAVVFAKFQDALDGDKPHVVLHNPSDCGNVGTILRSCETVSLLRVELITGRTHQIRAHLAAAGFPVCGDDRYGDRAKNRAFHVRTQQLWATELVFHFAGGPLAYLDGRAFSIRPRFTMRGFE